MNLKTHFQTGLGTVRAVDGVSFSIDKAEVFGLVGESGCGKSVTALSILGLVPKPHGRIVEGKILFEGQNLLELDEASMREIRGRKISLIFQDPTSCLDPIMKAGEQIVESMIAHRKTSRKDAWNRAVELLDTIGIPDSAIVCHQYPFQLSGGMKQRIIIAIAFASAPSLLIADEPTTSLDVSIQAQILQLIRELSQKTGTSVLLISHNLGIISLLCNRMAVMYAGKVVEYGDTESILKNPRHPYTELLLKSVPTPLVTKTRLETIQGDVPSLVKIPPGCRFHPRCPYSKDVCAQVEPSLIKVDGRDVRCLMHDDRIW